MLIYADMKASQVFSLAIVLSVAWFTPTQLRAPSPDYLVEKDVAVPMRDGTVLRADLLRPKSNSPFPVLVYRTPYGKEAALKQYKTFRRAVERGYAVMVEDVRGRYSSDGDFLPYQQEGHDGYDTIEWAARQPWSNGAVGSFGLSYPGAVQWLAAIEAPPHLKAMVPAMTFSTPLNFFYAGGTWDMSWIDWIWNNIAPDVRVKRYLTGPKTSEEAVAAWKEVRPKAVRELPLASLVELREIAPYYYEWLRHPPEDPWWDWCELRDKYDRVHAAVLNFSGWYDDNYGPEGATTNFAGLLKARTGERDPRSHLILGPWVHGVESTAKTNAGEREFGPAATIDYDEIVLRWLDHYVRGIDNGVEREKPVHYFVMGDNQWHDADSWPPPAKTTSYYLEPSKSQESPETNAKTLRNAYGGTTAFSSFVSDPADPVTNPYASSGAHDYREFVNRKDVLTFDSSPLKEDIEVTGPIHANIFLSCDCRDVDLWTRLLDVSPEGTALNLMSPGLEVLRASDREVKRGRKPLEPGRVYEVRLESLITSNVFHKGHLIRVQISASFFPDFSRNLQSGELEATSTKMHKATVRIYHDHQHPSRLILPVAER